jgi:1,4-alpha-glucan branching enzyme
MKKFIAMFALIFSCVITSLAQIVTTSPAVLQQSSQNVVLTYHADSSLGNGGLKGLSSTTAVYAHIGVITNKSNGSWAYAPTWLDNSSKYKLTYVSTDTWSLSIGDIRTYFGITDASEIVKQIAIVFRTSDGKKEGKTASGGDIFVDVAEDGFELNFTSSATSLLINKATSMTFTASTSQAATISIAVNGTTVATGTSKTSLSATYNFSAIGSYEVVATANNGSETLKKTLNVVYVAASTASTYPGGVPKMGAVKNSDGTVTFCLAAPGKSSVVLVPSWDNYEVLTKNVMNYQDYNGQRYFFTTVSGLKDDVYYPYYYYVDATYKVADPYAHLVLDCYSDKWIDSSIWPDMPQYPYDKFDDTMLAVYRGDADNYKFSNFTIPDHSNLVIYELLIRDFTGTEGKANADGTYRKAIEKIPYLKALGVNAVELMPVMEFNGNNSWGYNPNFYMAPDKAYGAPDDLKEFVELCHQSGMAVILDIVFNQSDGLHPWYQMYPSSSNPFYNATAPHAYSVLNDWKQENELVQQQWKDALQYWLTAYNVDGFRFDLVKGLGTSYTSSTEASTNMYNASRIAVMKNLHSYIKEVKPDGIHINEDLAYAQEENELAADGQLNWLNVNSDACQYAMAYASGSKMINFLATNSSRTWGSTVSYAESHDEERMGYKQIAYGSSSANGIIKTDELVRMNRLGAVAVQMLLTPGPKMIWQFGELGDEQTEKSGSSNNVDPKIVNWDYLSNENRLALHDVYAALCNLRKDNADLFAETATFEVSGFVESLSSPRVMRLTYGDKEVMAFINANLTSQAPVTISGTSTKLNASNCKLITSSKGITPELTGASTSVSVSLPANSFAVFATTNTAGVNDLVVDIDENAPVEYYNLNGVRIANPTDPGLYIRRQGATATKVVIK